MGLAAFMVIIVGKLAALMGTPVRNVNLEKR